MFIGNLYQALCKNFAYSITMNFARIWEISIVGLTYDCNVKIVDTAGSLIYEGTSVGVSFKWDGRNKKGDRVAAGVYYVLAYDQEGNEGVATKILFIR